MAKIYVIYILAVILKIEWNMWHAFKGGSMRILDHSKANLICVGCVGDLLLFSSCDRKWPRTRASTFQTFQCKQSDVLWIRTCGGKSVGTWNRLEKNIKSRPRICVIKVRYDIAPDTENSTYEAEAENSRMCNWNTCIYFLSKYQ